MAVTDVRSAFKAWQRLVQEDAPKPSAGPLLRRREMTGKNCTWKGCDKPAVHEMKGRAGNTWAHLCEEHRQRFDDAIASGDAKRTLGAWAKALSDDSRKSMATATAAAMSRFMQALGEAKAAEGGFRVHCFGAPGGDFWHEGEPGWPLPGRMCIPCLDGVKRWFTVRKTIAYCDPQ